MLPGVLGTASPDCAPDVVACSQAQTESGFINKARCTQVSATRLNAAPTLLKELLSNMAANETTADWAALRSHRLLLVLGC